MRALAAALAFALAMPAAAQPKKPAAKQVAHKKPSAQQVRKFDELEKKREQKK